MLVFLRCVCVCVCVGGWSVCGCVCVCGSGMLICFVSALGSHEMGSHKLPIIIIIIIITHYLHYLYCSDSPPPFFFPAVFFKPHCFLRYGYTLHISVLMNTSTPPSNTGKRLLTDKRHCQKSDCLHTDQL